LCNTRPEPKKVGKLPPLRSFSFLTLRGSRERDDIPRLPPVLRLWPQLANELHLAPPSPSIRALRTAARASARASGVKRRRGSDQVGTLGHHLRALRLSYVSSLPSVPDRPACDGVAGKSTLIVSPIPIPISPSLASDGFAKRVFAAQPTAAAGWIASMRLRLLPDGTE